MRPLSDNISDKIRPYSKKIRLDTMMDINLDILKI